MGGTFHGVLTLASVASVASMFADGKGEIWDLRNAPQATDAAVVGKAAQEFVIPAKKKCTM